MEILHSFAPVVTPTSRVLILGTMPGAMSLAKQQYYGFPHNAFWRIMAALTGTPGVPEAYPERLAMLRRHGIALWDVLAECTIEGASDASISGCVPNDIGGLLARAPIEAVFCTGAKATELYTKHCEPQTGVACVRLPSTSPANAAKSLEQLIEAYRVMLDHCR